MKYILLCNIDSISKNILIKSYQKEGYEIIENINNCILLKYNNNKIIDEEVYIKILYTYLKRSEFKKDINGIIIDLTDAFKYAESKNGYNKFDNKFDWYVRNTIIKVIFKRNVK